MLANDSDIPIEPRQTTTPNSETTNEAPKLTTSTTSEGESDNNEEDKEDQDGDDVDGKSDEVMEGLLPL